MLKTKTEIIADKLQAEIARGRLSDKLPSEQEIARIYSTTSVTAGKALNLLRRKNLIVRVPRLGSFVNREHNKPLKIYWGKSVFSESMNSEIKTVLKRKFPNRDIEMDSSSYRQNPFEAGYDIVRNVATFNVSYSKYVEPLPSGLKEKYLHGETYFKNAFNIHRDNSIHYSLPILFSPIVLLYNRELLNRFMKIEAPYDFKIEDMLELKNKIKKQRGIYLFERYFEDAQLRYFVFSGEDNEGSVSRINLDGLKKRLRIFWELFEDMLMSGKNHDFMDGNVLFKYSCRQGLELYKDAPFKWDILPMPSLQEKAVPVTGEFLMVSNKTADKEAAFEIAETFLSPEIQKIIAKNKCGLPVMKSLIPDTLDTRHYRDDIFVSEIPSLLLNNAMEQDFNLMLFSLYFGLIEKKYDFETFLEQMEKAIYMRREFVETERKIEKKNLLEVY